VIVENLDAVAFIARYDRPATFFYVDPPYYGTAGYAVPWPKDRYRDLAEALSGIAGKFLLSINDTPQVREIFSGFKIRTIRTRYSVADGRKQPDNRARDVAELIIGDV